MRKIHNLIIPTLTLATLFLAACGSAPKNSDGGFRVLASTTFLADIAQNIAGDRLQVDSLLPYGADPHAYQAAPADVAKIAESKLLIINGLEYERFIDPLIKNAGGERLIITASSGLKTLQLEEEPGVMAADPHMWLDPTRVIQYAENIRDGLIKSDPNGASIYKANAEMYITQLQDLDAWILMQVETIPVEHRLLVTNHEAMGYFADRYGFTIVATVIPSLSTDASTSAKELASVIDKIKASAAPAIFLGEVENPDLANQIAEETDVKVIKDLYLETLTEGAPAATYIDMMKHNVNTIVDGLK